jgi:N-acylneuraminate cytidylyltransferase/CMP-N,N'-diacetyllegionaminic acid synthase
MKRIATVCVRGGSKGVKGKNAILLDEKPLLAHSLLQIFESGLFDYVAVSSDDLGLLDIASDYGCKDIIKRPAHLATDDAPKLPVVRHCVEEVEKRYGVSMDVCVDFDATSPLRNIEDIKSVLYLCEEDNVSNVITGMQSRRSPYFNMVELDENKTPYLSKEPDQKVSRRQDSPKCYDMNASIYAWKRGSLFSDKNLFQEKTKFFEMPEERSIDIDTELDFKFVSFLIAQKKKEL